MVAASSLAAGQWRWRWRGSRRPTWRAALASLWRSSGTAEGSAPRCSGRWRWRTETWWMPCSKGRLPPPRCHRRSDQTPSNPKPADTGRTWVHFVLSSNVLYMRIYIVRNLNFHNCITFVFRFLEGRISFLHWTEAVFRLVSISLRPLRPLIIITLPRLQTSALRETFQTLV